MPTDRPAHHAPDGYRNPWQSSAPHGFGLFLKWQLERMLGRRTQEVFRPLLPVQSTIETLSPLSEKSCAVTWVGHSTFFIQIDGLCILTDPIWSVRASPFRWIGPHRLRPPGVGLSSLPRVDVVLISHDHYDHLDVATVRRLVQLHPAARWFAPLGVGGWLSRHGADDITELDWWGRSADGRLTISCTPAQHFSGRSLARNRTLWCGWTISSGGCRVFFAGDTALHPEFGEIAARYGPFDAVILPIGAYEPRWFMRPVHMDPSDAVTAFRQISEVHPENRTVMVPSHWGTFRLTDESPGEPPHLTRVAWSRSGLRTEDLWVLDPGETRAI